MKPEDKQQHESDIALSDAAIDWLVRLKSGQATAEDHAAFAAWRGQSTEHELAAHEAEAVWHGVGVAGDRARTLERKERRAKVTRRAVLGGGTLAAVGFVVARSGVIGPRLFADFVTEVGEQRTVGLTDGSSVFLNASSAFSVKFSAHERRLSLFEGQATFTVAHDTARPFVVEAGDGQTRAVGTVFDIDIRAGEVVVTVVEGVVAITTDQAPDPVIARVDQRVHYLPRGRPSAPEAANADIETAWRRGKLIFNRRPLADVVADIERYRRGRIVLVGDGLRSLEVTGVFDLNDPEAILHTIEDTLPVQMTRLPFVTIVR
ncbi:Probable FecR, iron siderophore sensor protein [Nitrobacter sp. Nb-311A]|uniref:FecR family protein n=1 Tax=unclassified Nitrobacter TaxID=2620411 RepID=UPI000068715C|nr:MULTISPECIES: FecR family protein [unclassified Nitrobacter]EAQ34361.1 Probable FecR, iron siderophore sensor protein [Nitrobacter sp. Nb-311A]MCB1393764.1 FecR family protein [Nitrobacter sp.]MCV0387749.1 FecR family protein [Nitrobacter sp.]